ncbi:MAG: TRAP transporter substrate-binding protein [Negativicutes bacterium]|nr:TRAP transporter substrate-binding protein [Negativicutes bacterium]
MTVEKFTAKIGLNVAPGQPSDLAMSILRDRLELEFDGKVELQIFPSSQCGNELTMIESVRDGTLEMIVTSTSPLGVLCPEFMVFDLPFLFPSSEIVDNLLDGSIGEEMAANLTKLNVVPLAWWKHGIRRISNRFRPITDIEDVKNLKIRTMHNTIHETYFSYLGAIPVPTALSDLYLALKNQEVDAQETPLSIYMNNKYYSLQKYLMINEYVHTPALVLANRDWFKSLPLTLQKFISEHVFDLRIFQREVGREQTKAYLEKLRLVGVELTLLNEIQQEAFVETANQIYPLFENQIGSILLEKIRMNAV